MPALGRHTFCGSGTAWARHRETQAKQEGVLLTLCNDGMKNQKAAPQNKKEKACCRLMEHGFFSDLVESGVIISARIKKGCGIDGD
uniref:Uncharacterized protein n=1 Tax=Parascaris equorum TaxID=6256 RepID=A0A914R6L6_PAREQ